MMNSEHFSINSTPVSDMNDALLFLAACGGYVGSLNLERVPKIILLLERGADIRSEDSNGRNSLHLVLSNDQLSTRGYIREEYYDGQDFYSTLMAFITAGADVRAVDAYGMTPSEIALQHSHEELWIEVLAKCGYDPWEVFLGQDEESSGLPSICIFPAVSISVRPTKLSFQEFSREFGSSEDFGIPNYRRKPVPEWWKECYGGICGIDECDTESECGSDDVSELEAIDCGDYWEDINPTNYREAGYRPINGDITWLAYIRRHKYLWYWSYGKEPGSYSDSSDSSDASEYDSEEDEYDSQAGGLGSSGDAEDDGCSEHRIEDIIGGQD